MKHSIKTGTLSAMALATTATLLVSCGGSDGGGDAGTPAATMTTIDAASVASAVASVSTLIPICDNNLATKSAATPTTTALVMKTAMLRNSQALSARTAAALPSTKPADTLGTCGGRVTYPVYNHLSGVTTATLEFIDYCMSNSATPPVQTKVNGSISFVDTGTPSASGPVRSKIEASSPGGVTIATLDTAGKPVTEVISFSNFLYTVGVPGGIATASSPDQFSLGELKTSNSGTQKTQRATDVKVSMFATASGGKQYTASGRGYRANGEFFDVSTSPPIVLDAAGVPLSGAIAFSGANGSAAIATLVPGRAMEATMTVNGTPLAGMPACKIP